MADRYYRKTTPDGTEIQLVQLPKQDRGVDFFITAPRYALGVSLDELWATWALIGQVLDGEPPAWAVGRIPATDVNGDPIEVKRDV